MRSSWPRFRARSFSVVFPFQLGAPRPLVSIPQVSNLGPDGASVQRLLLLSSDTEDDGQGNTWLGTRNPPHGTGQIIKTKKKVTAECWRTKDDSSLLPFSSSSDEEFEIFLSRMKTPKSLAHQVSKKQNSREDLSDFTRKNETSKKAAKNVQTQKKPVTSRKENTYSQEWLYPEILSDNKHDDSVFIKSSWSDHCQEIEARGLKDNLQHIQQTPSQKQKEFDISKYSPNSSLDGKERDWEERSRNNTQTMALRHSADLEPDSSEDEFESLIERIKKRSIPLTPSLTSNKTTLSQSATTELGNFKPPCDSAQHSVKKERIVTPKSESSSSKEMPSLKVPKSKSVYCVHSSDTEERWNLCGVPGCFLQELSNPASQYVKNFRKKKDELTQKLYTLYNNTIFEQKLPEKMEIIWNKKMRQTAGYCVTGQTGSPEVQRYARIELSEKVCDSADRLRDTLIHEICHAATWVINGIRDGHGQFWRFYAKKSTVVHPELPVVTQCHSYEIKYKFTYKCSLCKTTIGRHSKSLDTERFVCALCKGQLVLCQPTRKDGTPARAQLTPFAKYVKENYGSTKKEQCGLSHAEVMRKLSAEFALKTRLLDS
ncbi:membrane-associated progesterone receptor component 1 [Platysternon megacephalum]|uniref:Membrane-associated progesterone receptor component 1 n=1 Tax=Platysternon megacephalum TaxID=55544 RepID=A0A4D9EX89_9SAUR|nr:membrane-associated progesterone receptor component 1 [Platysternon megacephalum]